MNSVMDAKKRKALVLIDGSNMYYAQKKLGVWFDWVKVKNYLEKNFEVIEIKYYMGIRKNDQKVFSFISKLKKIGFKVYTKFVKVYFDDTGKRTEKANFDVEITGDSLTYDKKYDILALFSGDSDFLYLQKLLQKNGANLIIFSTKRGIAWELKLNSKHFFIEDIEGLTIEKKFTKI